MLNCLYVAESEIHGKGLFSSERIRPQTYIGTYQGPEAQRNGKYVLWLEDEEGTVGRRGLNKLRYVNHSRRPNAEFRDFELYALRTIRPDEEITVHYGEDWVDR